MNNIEAYFDLQEKIINSDFKIGLYDNPKDKEDLDIELKNNLSLKHELEKVQISLTEEKRAADEIRISFIHISNIVLENLQLIKNRGYYPDLNQSMVIPGYLFGKILQEFKFVLRCEGILPHIGIYMSKQSWPHELLQNLMQQIRDELMKSHFDNEMQAIEYYKHIENSFFKILDQLRKQYII